MWSQPLDFWIKTSHLGQRHAFRAGCPRFFAHIFSDLSPLQNSLHVKPWCQGAWQAKHQTKRHFVHVTFITSGLNSKFSCSVFAKSGCWKILEHPGQVLMFGFCSISTLKRWYFSKTSPGTSSFISSSLIKLSQLPSGHTIFTMASSIFDTTWASKQATQMIPEQHHERIMISGVSIKQTMHGMVILSTVLWSLRCSNCDQRKFANSTYL